MLLARSVLEPGEPFDVDVVLASRSETPTEYVDVSLVGEVGVAIPQGKTVAARQIQHVQRQAFRWTPGTLAVGDHRQRVRFVLPNWAPPSFRAAGGWCRVAYTVEVHVVIPMWIDRHAFFGLPVAAPAHVPAAETQALVATHTNGPQSGAMYIECSLDATELAPGEELRGDVSFANVAQKRVRRITLSIVGSERTRDPYTAANAVMRYATTLVSGPPPEGESFPFRFALPANLWPSFDARLFGLVWTFEVRADVVLGADVVLTIPIDVVRLPPGVEPPPRSHRAAPVGNQRLARLWTIVAQRKGISYDEQSATMIASHGAVSMTLAREAYEGTLGTVAVFRYPHLGLDVKLGERGLFALLTRHFDLPSDLANARFTVTGREPAQLQHFFDPELSAYLGTAARAELDDDQCRIHVPGAASSASALENVTATALHLMNLLDTAISHITPPLAVATFAPAWRAFADATSGRLELGRLWIHDASIGGFRFEVGTVFVPDSPVPRGTLARVPIEPPLDHAPNVNDAALSALARDALQALMSDPRFYAGTHELGIYIEGATPDPAVLAPKIEAMISVLRALRGAVAAGPFR
ncbi:MAG TPA: hypothetical protein VGH87_06060 [Polyangiaceae bacterium]